MPDNAPTNGAPTTTVGDVTSHASSLAFDLITLAELQVKLLSADLREVGTRSAGIVVGTAAMLVVAAGSVPVVLLGLSERIGDAAGWPAGVANMIVGGLSGTAGMLAAWIGLRRGRAALAVLARSRKELEDNLEFVKSLVADSRHPVVGLFPWKR